MMKRLFIVILLLAFIFNCSAQMHKNDNLYLIALEKYSKAIDTYYSKHNDYFGADSTMFKVIYLESPKFIRDIPTSVSGHKIVLITSINQPEIYAKHANRLIYTKIYELIKKKDTVKITIEPLIGELNNKGHYQFKVVAGTTVNFVFEPESKRFVTKKIYNWSVF